MSPNAAIAKPVVLVPACNRVLGEHPYHITGKKYIDAVRLAGCQPLVVPSAGPDELDALLDLADGVLLTGSPSNVHPSHFAEGVLRPRAAAGHRARCLDAAADPARPSRAACRCWPSAAARRKPTWRSAAACTRRCTRYLDSKTTAPPTTRRAHVHYGAAHSVTVEPGGMLSRILDRDRFEVNSIARPGA